MFWRAAHSGVGGSKARRKLFYCVLDLRTVTSLSNVGQIQRKKEAFRKSTNFLVFDTLKQFYRNECHEEYFNIYLIFELSQVC